MAQEELTITDRTSTRCSNKVFGLSFIVANYIFGFYVVRYRNIKSKRRNKYKPDSKQENETNPIELQDHRTDIDRIL
jgi:hypothetical protein